MCYVPHKEGKTFSPLEVKNKPSDGETEHAFILG
jgi:hypothetical protein